MPRRLSAVLAVTVCLVAPMVVGLPWVDRHLALRFMLLLVVGAVGLPYLIAIAIAWPGPPSADLSARSCRHSVCG